MEKSITAIDLILGGCCEDGVWEKINRRWKEVAAAMPVQNVLRMAGGDREIVAKALGVDGSGGCYGSGYGDSYDYDNGYGYGDSYGGGYDYDNGYGYGDAYGSGDGHGDGHGDGGG